MQLIYSTSTKWYLSIGDFVQVTVFRNVDTLIEKILDIAHSLVSKILASKQDDLQIGNKAFILI